MQKYKTLEWLMWQMGGVGPMFGQAHHFLRAAPTKIEYGIKRYVDEAKRLYGVLDKQLASQRLRRRRRLHDRRHGDLPVGGAP